MDALGETALSYGQVKAAATGDPLVLEQAELDVTIAQLQRLQTAHIRARKRDAQEAARAQFNAERALTRAEALRVLAENVAGCPNPGFSTRSGEQLTENPTIGAAIARQIQTLLFYKEGKEYVGSWSGEQVAVQVEMWGKEYTVNLLIGNDVLRVATSHSWMTKKQQWRFAEAIEAAVASARDKAEREEVFAEKARRQAEQLEKQARQPFLRAEELKARLARKADLDEYTALVAAAKKDAERQEELATRREQLLKNVPDFSFLADAVQPTPASRTNGSVVPLFGEPWASQSRALRRRGSRQRTTGSEMHGEQLTLFPGLVEREA